MGRGPELTGRGLGVKARAAAFGRRLSRSLPGRAFARYMDGQGGNWATLVAWNAFFAFFPMLLVTITVVGALLHNPGARTTIEQHVLAAFPPCDQRHPSLAGRCVVIDALNSFRTHTGILGVVGFLGLMWGGSSLFGTLDQALSALYPCRARDFIPQKLMSFGMILLLTVLTVPLLLSSSLLALLQSLPHVPRFFGSGPASLLIQIGVGSVDATLLFAVVYYLVPNRRQRLLRVLPGACVAGVLFELVTLLFPLYFSTQARAPAFGQTFALVFLLLFYFSVLGQIVMLAGALNAELDPDLAGCRSGEGIPAGGLPGQAVLRDDRREAVGAASSPGDERRSAVGG